jgi:hypothetical protein
MKWRWLWLVRLTDFAVVQRLENFFQKISCTTQVFHYSLPSRTLSGFAKKPRSRGFFVA